MIQTKHTLTEIYNSQKLGHQLTDEELAKLQGHLIKMYRDIAAVCNRHGINICLAYGNVIGAMRHGGWIPWDDDLDIHMSREDYELFLSKYANELPPQYKVSSYLSPDGSIARFAKIIDTSTVFVPVGGARNENTGVFIDIFPIDNVPKSEFVNKIRRYWAFFLMYTATSVMQVRADSAHYKQIMFTTKAGRANWRFRQCWGRAFNFIAPRTWHRWIERFAIRRKVTGYSHVVADLDVCFKKIPSDYYFPFQKISLPEIGEINIPNKYDEYLRLTYGDWTKIPDEKDRWHHYVGEFNIPD